VSRISLSRPRGPLQGDASAGALDSSQGGLLLRGDGQPGRAEPPLHSPVHEVADVDLIAVGADDTAVLPVGKLRLKLRGTLAPTRST